MGGGLLVGFQLPVKGQAQTAGPLKLNAFVKVGTDDTVTLEIHKSEMGQGTVTSLSQLLAEELECDWKKIRTEFPGVEPVYGAPMMGAYGSLSIRTSWQPLRQAGAAAREMLVQAAAQQWKVDKSQCRAENNTRGQHRDQRQADLWRSGRSRGETARAHQRSAEDCRAVQADRDLAQAPRYACEGQRLHRIRTRRAPSGDAVRLARALPGVRRQGRQFRRHESHGRAGREESRADFERRGRDRRQYLERDGRPQGARHQVGRGQVGQRIHAGSAAGMGGSGRQAGHVRCAKQATPRPPSPAPPRKSKRCTKRRIFRMLPWSR